MVPFLIAGHTCYCVNYHNVNFQSIIVNSNLKFGKSMQVWVSGLNIMNS